MGVPIGVTPVPKINVWVFDYFTPADAGKWPVNGSNGGFIPLWDTDDATATPPKVGTNSGAQLDIEVTGPDAYELTFTPLDNPAAAYTEAGTFSEPGEPVDWLEFTFFNTLSEEGFETDFFIKSIEIFDSAPAGVPGDYNSNGAVDAADYVVWRDRLGQTVQLTNEVSGVTPGMVTAEDYDAWRARFGNTPGPGVGAGISAAAVPEPSTFVYLVGALMGFYSFRKGATARTQD
jgi:hypothetical protein